MSDEASIRAALDRLLAEGATDADASLVQAALLAGQVVLGSHNVTAGRDIIDSTIVQVASTEAMTILLSRLFPHRINTLPPSPADFTGRAAELDTLEHHIEQAGVVITGMRGLGGIGKTALALVVAHQLAPRYPDAALYLNLRGASDSPLGVRDAQANVIHRFHPTAVIPDDVDELAALYNTTLSSKSGLLLLDDARDAAHIRPLIPPARWALLVTSRQRFHLPGLFPLDLAELPSEDSRVLLQAIVPRLTNAEADEIAGFCGQLPLALRLAGSALQNRPALTSAEYIRRLSDQTGRITVLDAAQQRDPTQPGIEASLRISYELLTPELQAIWRMLSVFPSSFDSTAVAIIRESLVLKSLLFRRPNIQRILDRTTDQLDELNQFSLLEVDVPGRYRMHDLARLFSGRQLGDSERRKASSRHARYFGQVLVDAGGLFDQGGDGQVNGLTVIDREWPNIVAAQAWATRSTDDTRAKLAIQFNEAGATLRRLRQHRSEVVAWAESAALAAKRLGASRSEAIAHCTIGDAHTELGSPTLALESFRRARNLSQRLNAPNLRARILNGMGGALLVIGEAAQAAVYLEEAVQIARQTGDGLGLANILGNLGRALAALGRTEQAVRCHQENLRVARMVGDRASEARALSNLGNAYFRCEPRRLQDATRCYLEHIELARELGDLWGESNALGNLGAAYIQGGLPASAISHLERHVEVTYLTGDRKGRATSIGNLGNVYLLLDDLGNAETHFREQIFVAVSMGDRNGEARGLVGIANIHAVAGQFAEAVSIADGVAHLLEQLGDPFAVRIRSQAELWSELALQVGVGNDWSSGKPVV